MTDMRLNLSLFAALVTLMFVALMLGSAPIGMVQAFNALFANADISPIALIIQEIRLPRILTGVMVGATLGLAGAALQGLLRNPLADPGVIGVNAMAGLGAVSAIQYGLAALTPFAIPGAAMVGACLSILILYALARRDSSVITLILVGVGINVMAGALTSLVMNLSANPFALSEMVLWLLGSLNNRSYTDIGLALPFMVAGVACLGATAPALRALTLGEDAAQTLGVNLARTRLLAVAGCGLSVGAAVAIAGMVGFIGLIVPHMMRPFVGHDPARLLLPSALCGALLITLADLIIRAIPLGVELKLGVVTALMGGPFFLYLVVKTRKMMR